MHTYKIYCILFHFTRKNTIMRIFMRFKNSNMIFYHILVQFYCNLFGSLVILLYFCKRNPNNNTSYEGKE